MPLALAVGANRVVPARAVTHPVGDPDVPPVEEKAFRRHLVERGLQAIGTPIARQTVF